MPKSAKYKAGGKGALTAVLVLAALALIYAVASYQGIGALDKWVVGIIALAVIGTAIQRLNGYQGSYGLYLLSTKRGIETLDSLARRRKELWIALSTWGIVLGFGLASYPLMKGKISKKVYVLGIASIVAMFLFVLPFLSYGLAFVNLPQLQGAGAQGGSAQASQLSPVAMALLAVTVLFGFGGYVLILLVYNAVLILAGVAQFALSIGAGNPQTSTLTNQIPGVAPLIPGIDIPLVAGAISLIILLTVHEGAHGVLARIYKVRIKSVGALVFGAIPVGGFVEPDEKEVDRLDGVKQSMVFSSGISMNFAFTLVFFALMLVMLYLFVPSLYANFVTITNTAPGLPAYNVLRPGMQIVSWNGYGITGLGSFAVAASNDIPGATITVGTANGTYTFKAVSVDNSSKGFIGVTVGQPMKTDPLSILAYFLYTVFTLSFMLNFLVATVNLLPLPFFDGWRLYQANIRNRRIVRVLAGIVVLSIVANILPWFSIFLLK